jgi:hypothetical protein
VFGLAARPYRIEVCLLPKQTRFFTPLLVAGLTVGMASPVARAASPSSASAVSRVQVTNVVKTMPQGDNNTIPDITAAAAVLTLLFISWQVGSARRDATRDRTATLTAQLGDRKFREQLSLAIAFLDLEDKPGADRARDCADKISA